MPIVITTKEFIDAWGNSTPFYVSNAGDRITMKLNIRASIHIQSAANPIIFNPLSPYTLTSGGVSFEAEGFRVGDTAKIRITDQNGATLHQWTTTIYSVTGNVMGIDSMPFVLDSSQQQLCEIWIENRARESFEGRLNHVDNSVPSNDFSLIDGEASRFKFSDINSMTVGSTQNAIIVGDQSGQYLYGATLKRNANLGTKVFVYELSVDFVNSGAYDATWFDSSDCLKVILKMLWSSIEGEPYAQTQVMYNDSANTGHFDQAHNVDEVNAELVQGVSEIDYSIPTAFTAVVDGEVTDLGFGCTYLPKDDSYYKNKPLQQGRYGMIIPTTPLSVATFNSLSNDTGVFYQIKIDDIQTVGTVTSIEFVFLPTSQFTAFIESREEDDREFELWVKCGNLNLTVFRGQLTTSPPEGGELIMISSFPFVDHSDNRNEGFLDIDPVYNRFDTEDDIAYFGTFLMDKDLTGAYSSLRIRMEAFNTVTEEDFTLKQTVFSLATTQVDANGVYLIDETTTVNPNLPLTSLKRDAIFKRDSSIDTLTQFGVSIYYPVVLDWKYWLPLPTASVDFYPNQNRNWQQYSDSGNWVVRMELELIKSGLAFTHSDQLSILDYNAKAQILSTMQYSLYPAGTVTTGLIAGQIMKLRARHESLLGGWNPETWGNIRIEKKENAPDDLSSTILDFDNDASNPLYPLPGETKAKKTITGNIVFIECLCDTNKLPSPGTYSVAYKIADPNDPLPPVYKTTSPDDINKTTTDGDFKTLA